MPSAKRHCGKLRAKQISNLVVSVRAFGLVLVRARKVLDLYEINCLKKGWARLGWVQAYKQGGKLYLLDHHTGGKRAQWDDGPANKV